MSDEGTSAPSPKRARVASEIGKMGESTYDDFVSEAERNKETMYDRVSRMMNDVEMGGGPSAGGGGHFMLNQAWTGTIYFEGSTNNSVNSYQLYTAACIQHPILRKLVGPPYTGADTVQYSMEIHGYTMEGADNNTIIMHQPNFSPDGAKGKRTIFGDGNTPPASMISDTAAPMPMLQPRKVEFAYPVVGQSNAKLGFQWPESLKILGSTLDSNVQGRALSNFQSQAIDPATVSVDKYYVKFLVSVRFNDKFTLTTIIPTFQIENIKELIEKIRATPAGEQGAVEEKFWADKAREMESEREMIKKVRQMRALGHDIPKNQF